MENVNAMKQELFILRQTKIDDNKKIESLQDSVTELTTKMSMKSRNPIAVADTINTKDNPNEIISTPEKEPQSISTACIIGDSIVAKLDTKVIATVIGREVRTARAYSTLNESDETEAMEKTKFPDKNFGAVIARELEKAPTDTLIIQAGSVDITNMKTGGNNVKRFSEYFKQQAVISAKNLFSDVSNALAML